MEGSWTFDEVHWFYEVVDSATEKLLLLLNFWSFYLSLRVLLEATCLNDNGNGVPGALTSCILNLSDFIV